MKRRVFLAVVAFTAASSGFAAADWPLAKVGAIGYWFNAQGHRVGPVFPLRDGPLSEQRLRVLWKVDTGSLVFVDLMSRDGMSTAHLVPVQSSDPSGLYFQALNCAGTPHVVDMAPKLGSAPIVLTDTTAYVGWPDAYAMQFSSRRLLGTSTCVNETVNRIGSQLMHTEDIAVNFNGGYVK